MKLVSFCLQVKVFFTFGTMNVAVFIQIFKRMCHHIKKMSTCYGFTCLVL